MANAKVQGADGGGLQGKISFSVVIPVFNVEPYLGQCLDSMLPALRAEDEIILLADLVGGSPLTTAANVIAEENLMGQTVMVGGVNLPFALSAVLMKDTMETPELIEDLLSESREVLKEFRITNEESEDEI